MTHSCKTFVTTHKTTLCQNLHNHYFIVSLTYKLTNLKQAHNNNKVNFQFFLLLLQDITYIHKITAQAVEYFYLYGNLHNSRIWFMRYKHNSMISKAVIANTNSHSGTEVHGHMLVTLTSLMTWVSSLAI